MVIVPSEQHLTLVILEEKESFNVDIKEVYLQHSTLDPGSCYMTAQERGEIQRDPAACKGSTTWRQPYDGCSQPSPDCVSLQTTKSWMPKGAVSCGEPLFDDLQPSRLAGTPALLACLLACHRVRQGYVPRPFQAAGQSGEAMQPRPLYVHRRHRSRLYGCLAGDASKRVEPLTAVPLEWQVGKSRALVLGTYPSQLRLPPPNTREILGQHCTMTCSR